MSDNDLIREARACYAAPPAKLAWALADALEAANARVARIERLLEHIDAARAGYDALVARADQLEKALNEALDALKDARFTFMSLGEHGYEDDCTEAIRCGEAALAGVPAEPATEVRTLEELLAAGEVERVVLFPKPLPFPTPAESAIEENEA